MVSFIVLSDKFTSPISSIATTGQLFEEDDAFQVVNLQIEQRRKNSVGRLNLTQYGTRRSLRLADMPSWAILLNLRANAAYGMLLRPFFFAKMPTAAGKRNMQPALHIIFDTINILFDLEKSTDIYRKQHPNYQHLLASSSALMFLVVVYVEQNGTAAAVDLPDDFAYVVGQSYRKALHLATTYKTFSRASRRLSRRLILLKEPLHNLGITWRAPGQGSNVVPSMVAPAPPSRPTRACGQSTPRREPGSAVDALTRSQVDAAYNGEADLAQLEAVPSAAVDESGGLDESWVSNLLYDWPLTEANTFFSEGGF